ncbi:FraH-related protein [Planktothrix tepida]|uniref:FraH-related protein n=1 Tax=Planktothrix tepida PCC 9214 TaxID=671072 RepID=A0A1J1LSL2_9CYAN
MLKCPVCSSDITTEEEMCLNCGYELKPQPLIIDAPPPVSPVPIPALVELSTVETTSIIPEPLEFSPNDKIPITSANIILKRGGTKTTQMFSIEGERVIIGRFDPDSGPVDIDLGCLPESEAEYISRHHAEIRQDGSGEYFIKDLSAKNGTFFRASGQSKFQRVIDEQVIHDGDEIALGNVQFEFRVG